MYFVGIDISKFKHDCAIIDELGDVTSIRNYAALANIITYGHRIRKRS